jgi:hypothetical protein
MVRRLSTIVLLAFAFFFLFQCGRKGVQVEKATENGVEVVTNHLEPYSLPGVPSTLKLEKVLSIDTEKDEIAKAGLTTMETFAVDSAGNIYFMLVTKSDNFLYKFDRNGKFLTSFGRKGQGPGEFDYGGDLLVDGEDRVIAKDMTKEKFIVFGNDGAMIEEIKLDKHRSFVKYLGHKKFLTEWQEDAPEKPVYRNHYCISNDTLSENQEFYRFEFDDSSRAPRYRAVGSGFVIGGTDGNIFVGDSTENYAILVFNLEGKLARKIRKAFRPVPVTAEFKTLYRKRQERRGSVGQELLSKVYFPPHLPPFRYLFSDDQGRLYVMTYEREGERNYSYDIFTSEGVFIGRFELDNVRVNYFEGQRYNDSPMDVLVRGDRLYCLREKDSGFRVLTVYKMRWESD